MTGLAQRLVEAPAQLRVLLASKGRFEAEIARLARQQPNYELFANLPAIGPTFAPRLWWRLASAASALYGVVDAKEWGIAPVMESNGKLKHAAPQRLRTR